MYVRGWGVWVGGGVTHTIHRKHFHIASFTSCIRHEVLTEQRAHSPFPLATCGWHSAQASMNKLFRPLSVSPSLCPSLSLQALALLLAVEGKKGGVGGAGERATGLSWIRAGPTRWLCWWNWLSVPCAPEQHITAGLVFRQSDRSQPEYPENRRNQQSTHISPPSQHLYPLSLSLFLSVLQSFFFFFGLSLHPSLLRISFSYFPPLVHSPPLFSPDTPSTRLSLILSCFSLCLPPSPFEIQ